MVKLQGGIDVKESYLRHRGDLLSILLLDQTTKKNIIWATDSYKDKGPGFYFGDSIKPELVTGKYHKLIQPRASKSLSEQHYRTKEKAEVFTPRKIIKKINNAVDEGRVVDKTNWQEHVRELRLEITCGEAPFIASRYNPTSNTRKLLKIKYRVGFLDRKLREISKYCDSIDEWLFWAKEAYKSSYGYEWQGDNILIARENLLYTLNDYFKDKFKSCPTIKIQEEFAEIIRWNIFQMDGLKYVIPMSCHHETRIKPGDLGLFWETPDTVEEYECEGCKYNRPTKHNGKYVKIMDWDKNKQIKFVDLLKKAL